MDTTVAQTSSWWASPEARQDFASVAAAEAPRMRAKNFTTADYLNALSSAKRSMGVPFGTRRKGDES